MQWKLHENVSEVAGHQDSPVETMLVQIIMCHHVQKPTLKAILCIPYCSAVQCMKLSDWSVAHADCTLQPHTAPAVRLPLCADSPSLACIQTLSQSVTGGKSFTLPLCAPNNDGGRLLSSTPPFTSVCKPLTCLKAWSHMGVNAVPQPAVPSTPPPPPFSSLTGLQRSKHPAGFTSLPLILHCRWCWCCGSVNVWNSWSRLCNAELNLGWEWG